jgi:hypothetical protein
MGHRSLGVSIRGQVTALVADYVNGPAGQHGHGESPRRRSTPNRRLAAVLAESGMSRKGFARAVCAVAGEMGYSAVRYDHVSVTRWLAGTVPRRDTAHAITVVLGRAVGRTVTLADIGLSPAAPRQADDRSACGPASWSAEVHQVRQRLNWLAEEIASLSRHLAIIGPQGIEEASRIPRNLLDLDLGYASDLRMLAQDFMIVTQIPQADRGAPHSWRW